jgi:hypothetical protein
MLEQPHCLHPQSHPFFMQLCSQMLDPAHSLQEYQDYVMALPSASYRNTRQRMLT